MGGKQNEPPHTVPGGVYAANTGTTLWVAGLKDGALHWCQATDGEHWLPKRQHREIINDEASCKHPTTIEMIHKDWVGTGFITTLQTLKCSLVYQKSTHKLAGPIGETYLYASYAKVCNSIDSTLKLYASKFLTTESEQSKLYSHTEDYHPAFKGK